MNKEELLKKYSEPIRVGSLGMVRLVDVMGDDNAIVQAARVSYGAGTKAVSEDTALIRYLMRHQHTSPFEMCEIKLHIKAPIHVMRQWIRHRTASVNETSTRYSVVQDEFEMVNSCDWRLQAKNNKQGSSGFLVEADPNLADIATDCFETCIEEVYKHYKWCIDKGVAREQARNILPLATYTECYWKIDLHNLFHFLRLRLDPHAQKEIRDFAQAITTILQDWVPNAYQAFVDYRLEGAYFSREELQYLNMILDEINDHSGHVESLRKVTKLSKREIDEFLGKFKLQ